MEDAQLVKALEIAKLVSVCMVFMRESIFDILAFASPIVHRWYARSLPLKAHP